MAEKILANHSVPHKESVSPGEYIWAKVDATNIMAAPRILDAFRKLGVGVFDPDRIFAVDDHDSPPQNIAAAEAVADMEKFVKEYGIKHWFEYGRHGIQHQLFPENGYCVPGDLIVMMDSHSTTYGAFNAASSPIAEELPYVLAKGQLWFRVPHSIKFWLEGTLPPMCVGKDVILKIAGDYGTDVGLYKSVEFLGPLAEQMKLSDRWTIANMGIEIGAKFALFEADQKTSDFLKGRADRSFKPVSSDSDATYEHEYEFNATYLEPMVACPHDPGNSKPAREVEKEKIKIHQALLGTCTNARMDDLHMAARILKGRKVHPDVKLIVSPSSMEVWREALKGGVLDMLVESRGCIVQPTCGPCYGGHTGVLGAGQRCISTGPRNFQGRMGSPQSEVYLANAATVAASAIAGEIVDPRRYE